MRAICAATTLPVLKCRLASLHELWTSPAALVHPQHTFVALLSACTLDTSALPAGITHSRPLCLISDASTCFASAARVADPQEPEDAEPEELEDMEPEEPEEVEGPEEPESD